jgi:two-component system NtrC family sensor kinase
MFAGGPHNTVMLLRDDGVILAAYPALPLGTRVSAGPAVPRPRAADAAAIHTVVSPADGIKRLVGYRALAGYPVMVSYGVAYDTVFDAWFTRFALYGMVALAAAMVLSVSTLAALSGERRERVAVAAWQSEQVRRMAAEAEAQRMSKYEALGTLAGGIAHHFNNLLPALTGHLDIAIKEAGADSPAAPRLMRLSAEIDGARQLIRNILLYSRRDLTGFRAVNISALAAGAIEMFRASLDGRTRVRTNIAPGIHVMGDRAQLVEIVMNLLSNARDAVAANAGEIMLTVDRSVGDDGRLCARIICADQGCGMPPEVAERAFDPFYTTKPPGSGTGLGLAICDGIVRSHGGRIAMDTTAGRGTTFTVSIPLLQQGERDPCASC